MSDPPTGRDERAPGLRRVRVERGDSTSQGAASGAPVTEHDWLAIEEPLEMRVEGEPFAVTMRTPGHDRELAAGFLYSEGVIRGLDDLESIAPCRDPLAYDPDNLVEIRLTAAGQERTEQLEKARRELVAVSACGLCGKARLEEVYQRLPAIEPMAVPAELVRALPERMRARQPLFERTGGLHGAALFDAEGQLLDAFEDIGRHNAVDKLIGSSLLRGALPWTGKIVVVSSRAGFEIVQKVLMARAPVLVTVGAASSLAHDLACRGGLELHTFVRRHRSNRHLPSERS